MNQLHITLEENSPAIKWANTQADRIGARGHVGTHLDCYTTVPEKPEYNITAMVLDCQNEMPKEEDIKSLTTLENMALLLHTANLERNEYGTDTAIGKYESDPKSWDIGDSTFTLDVGWLP